MQMFAIMRKTNLLHTNIRKTEKFKQKYNSALEGIFALI